jgi:hypothetical protein
MISPVPPRPIEFKYHRVTVNGALNEFLGCRTLGGQDARQRQRSRLGHLTRPNAPDAQSSPRPGPLVPSLSPQHPPPGAPGLSTGSTETLCLVAAEGRGIWWGTGEMNERLEARASLLAPPYSG